MASEHLGPVFEIHGGGLDLVFPHHENELAQSRALGHEFARIWTHNGMLQMVGEKMSKSLGNIVTLRDALERWGPETILLFFMTAHWRSPIDLSDETLEAARAQTQTFRDAFVAGGSGGGRLGGARRACSRTTSTRRTRWQCCTGGGRQVRSTRFGAGWSCSGSAGSRSGRRRRRRSRLWPRRGPKRARRGDYAEADRLRGEIEAAGWEVRDVAGGFELVPR